MWLLQVLFKNNASSFPVLEYNYEVQYIIHNVCIQQAYIIDNEFKCVTESHKYCDAVTQKYVIPSRPPTLKEYSINMIDTCFCNKPDIINTSLLKNTLPLSLPLMKKTIVFLCDGISYSQHMICFQHTVHSCIFQKIYKVSTRNM